MSSSDNSGADEHHNGEDEPAKESADEPEGHSADKPRSRKPLIILAAVIVVLAIGVLVYWFTTRNELTTDDAFIDGNAVTMAPKVTGYFVELYINDNVSVRAG